VRGIRSHIQLSAFSYQLSAGGFAASEKIITDWDKDCGSFFPRM